MGLAAAGPGPPEKDPVTQERRQEAPAPLCRQPPSLACSRLSAAPTPTAHRSPSCAALPESGGCGLSPVLLPQGRRLPDVLQYTDYPDLHVEPPVSAQGHGSPSAPGGTDATAGDWWRFSPRLVFPAGGTKGEGARAIGETDVGISAS